MESPSFKYTAILGWSASRYETFTQCKRRYYYQYYGKYDREQGQLISQLKALTSIPLMIGTIVHEVIKTILQRLQKTTQTIDQQRFRVFLDKAIEQQCREKTFFEVYYGQMKSVEIKHVLPQIECCLTRFLESPRFEWFKDTALTTKDQWIIEPSGYGEARMDDLKIYCKVDCLIPMQDNTVIIDWKTGKPDLQKTTKQLTGYATWAACQDQLPAHAIDPMAVYLQPSYQETTVSLTDHDLALFREQIKQETEDMHAFCQDIEENIPLAKNSFPMTSDSQGCKFCNFRELCGR